MTEPLRAQSPLDPIGNELHLIDRSDTRNAPAQEFPGVDALDDGSAMASRLWPETAARGRLFYGEVGVGIDFDGRTLAHLRVVIFAKLRRGESFALNWSENPDYASRNSIWLNPAIPLRFVFDHGPSATLNREWVEALMATANSAGGLVITAEP